MMSKGELRTVRKSAFFLSVLAALLICSSLVYPVFGAEASKPAVPAGLKFIETSADDQEWADIQSVVQKYEQGYVDAVNKGDFKIVEPFITPGSSFYNQQKKLVASLFKQGTKEKLVKYTLERAEDLNSKYKVYVVEEIEISTPGKAKKVNEYVWIYDINKTAMGWKVGAIAKWTDYDEYVKIASGRVKTDGYYVDDFCRYYGYLLTDAVNSLYIGALKRISGGSGILEQQKKLITDLRRYGTAFELLEPQNIEYGFNEKELKGTSSNNYIFKYKTGAGSQSRMEIKLKFDLEEVRTGYDGYAKILGMQVISISDIGIPSTGKTLQSFVPKGWKVLDKVDGDLNKDNLADTAAVLEQDMELKTQGYDTAPERILIILFKQKDGSCKLAADADKAVLRANEGGIFGDPYDSISIKNGVLSIAFYGGSIDRWGYTYKFRYQNGGWYMIGATLYNCNIGSGEYTTEDFNLSTGMETITKGIEGGKSTSRTVNRGKKALVELKGFNASSIDAAAF